VGDRTTPSETFVRREIDALAGNVDLVVASMDSGRLWAPSTQSETFAQRSSAPLSLALRWATAAAARELWGVSRVEERGCLSALRRALAADRIAREIGVPDLVHAHFASAPASVARLLARLIDRPWGVSVHARDFYANRGKAVRALKAASYVVACSDVLADDLRTALRAARSYTPVYTVHHGLDLERWIRRPRIASARPRIVAAGRFVPKKGFDTLIEAMALLASRGFAAELQLLGDGPLGAALRGSIQARGLGDRAQLGPWLRPEEFQRVLAKASVFVVPSRIAADGDRDNIPNVLIEAYASGVPTVATSLPAMARLVGKTQASVLVPSDDPLALSRAIERVCTDGTLADSLRAGGRALVRSTFDQTRTTALLYDCFARHARSRVRAGCGAAG
jgi:glycosyltransferase involved in cell wall biosynthesis